VLRIYEDLPEQRVADILGCRPGTVRSLVSRGLAELRIHVRSDGDG
jgi:DNA-directed RNA polymerase specialized sigma24 family protein